MLEKAITKLIQFRKGEKYMFDYNKFKIQLLQIQEQLKSNTDNQKMLKAVKDLIEFVDSLQELSAEEQNKLFWALASVMAASRIQK